jgi:hypothetical protein
MNEGLEATLDGISREQASAAARGLPEIVVLEFEWRSFATSASSGDGPSDNSPQAARVPSDDNDPKPGKAA